jgi:transcriptional regulator with GAF, ATPase, and Fis domain
MNLSSQPKVYLGMPAILASPVMQGLLRTVERVARTNASILIQGETGSGKELIARAVHHFSLRSAHPWVDMSCATLPEHLVESELFGYEKGAFSGAETHKPGFFEMAHNGTLFLDEAGELNRGPQVKLLRVLDGSPYFRLGGTRKIQVDVRIVAATNRDLESMVELGEFRGDLYHRLSQICLRVPPLRERMDDILPLAVYFLAQIRPDAFFSSSAASLLLEYSWPGNIRELRNVITKVAIMTNECQISVCDLAPELLRRKPSHHSPSPKSLAAVGASSLDGIERNMIMQVMQQTNGHQEQAAGILGISRRTLSRRLKCYEIESAKPSARTLIA